MDVRGFHSQSESRSYHFANTNPGRQGRKEPCCLHGRPGVNSWLSVSFKFSISYCEHLESGVADRAAHFSLFLALSINNCLNNARVGSINIKNKIHVKALQRKYEKPSGIDKR